MNELVDMSPSVNVDIAEYQRLLGYPRGHAISRRALELIVEARSWYAANGNPWVYARQARDLSITNDSVAIDGQSFHSSGLQALLRQAKAEHVVLVAVSAGPEIEIESQRRWLDEKPDEYFFFEVYGSAIVEHLVTMCGVRLCAWAEPQRMAVLPHTSPGYTGWDVSDQGRLLQLIREGSRKLPNQLDALPSGMLRPKKSQLAVFGVTRHRERIGRLGELSPCEGCSFLPCQFRRTPYRRSTQLSAITLSGEPAAASANGQNDVDTLDQRASYAVHVKALARWAAERLTLTQRSDGTTDALFCYEGTTCTNLGRRLLFHYHVRLGPARSGYQILAQQCRPAPGDEGYLSMCEFLDNPESLMAAIDEERPLVGEPLASVLSWKSPSTGAGCYCAVSDRMHKWRLVLETIHFALADQERKQMQFSNHLAGVP